jgi:hypothetical protein
MQNDFFGRARFEEEFTLSSGEVVTAPARYYDFAAITAVFPASAGRVRALLPTDRLRLVCLLPGVTAVALAAMEYRRWSARADGAEDEPYNEVAVMVPVLAAPAVNVLALPLVVPNRFKTFGWYVHRLPVTTALARDAGIEALGLPKFLAEITFTETARTRSCRLRADGREILTLEVEKLPARPRRIDDHIYGIRDGVPLRTRFETEGKYGIASFRGGASYTLGDHPIAEEMRELKMGHMALQRQYAPHVQALLHAPVGHRPSVREAPAVAAPAGQ